MSKKSHLSLHDKFFKVSMQDVRIAQDFFKAHLPPLIQEKLDWGSLCLQSGSFIDDDYSSSYTDVLYRATLSGESSYFYVLSEHQSTPDRWMPLRLWSYLCRIWERCLKQSGKRLKKLPLIYPVVLYHGRQSPYPFQVDFFELFDDPPQARKLLLSQGFCLIDLTVISDDDLSQHGYVAAMELLQKHVLYKNLLPIVRRLAELGFLQKLNRLDRGEYILKLLNYALEKDELNSKDELINVFVEALPDERGNIMTAAEQLRQEGRKQGVQLGLEQGLEQGVVQGIQKGSLQMKVSIAKNMLDLGMDVTMITKATGISKESLLEMSAEV
jgi:predicted transposase/invertase (TIGR01784 family)